MTDDETTPRTDDSETADLAGDVPPPVADDDAILDETVRDETVTGGADVLPTSREELEALLAARDADAQERHLRLAAEYQNYRRRVEREREVWGDEAIEAFVRDLLPVLDSFDRALAAGSKDPSTAASGLDAVDRQLKGALEKHGVSVVDPAGEPFDPRYHEAILRATTKDAAPGTVLAVLEKGWMLRSRLVRAARVQVAAAPDKG